MIAPRNRPALMGSLVAATILFVLLWWLGLSPLVAWVVAWSLPTFVVYGIDKRQADRAGWRIPEALLHALALVGGVLGAWAGRAWFRHKTQKLEFLVVLVVASIAWGALALWALSR